MSIRDFEAIAKIISVLREDSLFGINDLKNKNKYSWINSNELINQLANYFLSQNPRFDFDRFYDACMIREYENDISNSNRSVSPLV